MDTINKNITGCYIDGAIPRTETETILKMLDILTDFDPRNKLITEFAHINASYTVENSDDIIMEIEQAINDNLPNDLIAQWYQGDFIISKISEVD